MSKEYSQSDYKYGFSTEIKSGFCLKGLTQANVEKISSYRKEPNWLLEFRLKAYKNWKQMKQPKWGELEFSEIDYQSIVYYSESKKLQSEEIDPKILETFEKLGIPLSERDNLSGVAVDAVFDSNSVKTTFKKELADLGIIFCSLSEAVQDYPQLVKKYLGSVVPFTDNFFACLNSAVFSDGSFVYIPPGVHCPMELSTYFRINSVNLGQFERTLVIADKNSFVSYLEGCTAPIRDQNQLHAAVVELVALEGSEIRYSTVQNWYPGDKNGVGGVYNFVTKRGICKGSKSKISWTQLETGSSITWKYPSVILKGDESVGEFYSVAVTNNQQQADTGTKMIHIGKNTKSRIISKGISGGYSKNTYRGRVKISRNASNSTNFTQCDSLLLSDTCFANTFPEIETKNATCRVEHEATSGKLSKDKLSYLFARGLNLEQASNLMINGYCQEILKKLPMEFAVEAKKLLEVTLEGAVG